jgi:hypothetical protein
LIGATAQQHRRDTHRREHEACKDQHALGTRDRKCSVAVGHEHREDDVVPTDHLHEDALHLPEQLPGNALLSVHCFDSLLLSMLAAAGPDAAGSVTMLFTVVHASDGSRECVRRTTSIVLLAGLHGLSSVLGNCASDEPTDAASNQ